MTNQDAMLKKLPEILRNLPSEGCLQMCYTEEAKQEVQKIRQSYILVADAWEAKFKGKDDEFQYDQFLENQGIDPLRRKAIWKVVKEYTLLWQIVKLAEPYLKKYYIEKVDLLYQDLQKQSSLECRFMYRILSPILRKPYNFESSDSLFQTIVEEEQEMIVMDILGLSNYQFSVNQTRNALNYFNDYNELVHDNKNISHVQIHRKEQKIVDYINYYQLSYSWKELIIFLVRFSSVYNLNLFNKKLTNKVEEYHKLIFYDMIPLALTALRKRDSKTWKKIRSHKWENGHKIYLDHKVDTLPLKLNPSTCPKCQELEHENQELKIQIKHLEMVNLDQNQKIQELECLSDPYSCNGDAICNFDG